MGINLKLDGNRFYLVTIDILKGIAIFPMIIGHAIQWYYQTNAIKYEESSLAVFVIIVAGLVVFPCFLFIYGFNLINSFLQRGKNPVNHKIIRNRTIKRSLIFLFLATLAQILMSLIRSPKEPVMILNYIFTWHLLHIFSFTTITLLLIWQVAISLSQSNLKSNWNYLQYLRIFLFVNLMIVLLLFVICHSYTLKLETSFPVTLEPYIILERSILDIGSYGLIPWFSFSLSGGLIASFLNLPDRKTVKITKLDISSIVIGIIFCILGFFSFKIERFVSPALSEPSSFPHVFISIGVITLLTTLLIILLDLYRIIPHTTVIKQFYPIISLSKISFTVYLFHPLIGFLKPSIIPSELIFFILAIIYSLLFVIIAHIWQYWDFKYSFEWIIRKYS